MTIIHTGNTTTTGFVVTSDATGNLVVKTGGSGGTTALTVDADQRVSFTNPPLTSAPAFHVRLITRQSVTSGEPSKKVQFNDIVFDTDGYWNTGNFRYTPLVAGYYQFNAQVYSETPNSGTTDRVYVEFFKNGSATNVRNDINTGVLGVIIASTSHLIYCNGSTDYVEVYASNNGTNTGFGAYYTHFSGFLVRAT